MMGGKWSYPIWYRSGRDRYEEEIDDGGEKITEKKPVNRNPHNISKENEYNQIREDVRHVNNMFYYTFFVIVVVMSLLATTTLDMRSLEDNRVKILIGLFGVGVLIFAIGLISGLDGVRTKGISRAKVIYPDTFLKDIEDIHNKVFLSGKIAMLLMLTFWILYLTLVWMG